MGYVEPLFIVGNLSMGCGILLVIAENLSMGCEILLVIAENLSTGCEILLNIVGSFYMGCDAPHRSTLHHALLPLPQAEAVRYLYGLTCSYSFGLIYSEDSISPAKLRS